MLIYTQYKPRVPLKEERERERKNLFIYLHGNLDTIQASSATEGGASKRKQKQFFLILNFTHFKLQEPLKRELEKERENQFIFYMLNFTQFICLFTIDS